MLIAWSLLMTKTQHFYHECFLKSKNVNTQVHTYVCMCVRLYWCVNRFTMNFSSIPEETLAQNTKVCTQLENKKAIFCWKDALSKHECVLGSILLIVDSCIVSPEMKPNNLFPLRIILHFSYILLLVGEYSNIVNAVFYVPEIDSWTRYINFPFLHMTFKYTRGWKY